MVTKGAKENGFNLLSNTISIVLDVSEATRTLEPIQELFAVLYVRQVVLDATLEDVGERVLTHEFVRENPDRLAKLVSVPKPPQVGNGVDTA